MMEIMLSIHVAPNECMLDSMSSLLCSNKYASSTSMILSKCISSVMSLEFWLLQLHNVTYKN